MQERLCCEVMDTLDIRQLECFIVVAEERHVGRAAARLHMSQPPLTRRIARLERELGVRLFIRTPSGVALTEPGQVLLDRAHHIVRLSRNAVERTRLADAGEIGQLVVGFFGSTIFDAVPRLLRGFLRAHPEVTLTLEQTSKDAQADALRDGRMHIGFSRFYRDEPGLEVRRVLTEPLFLALPTGHPLLNQADVRVADLRDVDLVLFPAAPRPSLADEISQLCRESGFAVRAAREAEDAVTALAYVAAAGLCAVIPKSATNLGLPGVEFIPLTAARPQQVSCLYRAGERPPVLRAFLRHLSSWSTAGDS
jgi:DNA-binding transcriptional LysR family regulator